MLVVIDRIQSISLGGLQVNLNAESGEGTAAAQKVTKYSQPKPRMDPPHPSPGKKRKEEPYTKMTERAWYVEMRIFGRCSWSCL